MEMCKMIVITGETKRGEDSDISQQGSVVGLRCQHISLPFLGIGPGLMISHADVSFYRDKLALVPQEHPNEDPDES